ncbi:MAG: AAA family ATPase [Gammaproteobacteria bacterium]|nr:AAA family ATPase [Gammaproteobacteria bacterium]
MSAGRVILLNGSSSAGKTTLAQMLQQILPEPWQLISLDQFRDGLPARFRGLNSPEGTPGARGLNITPVEGDGRRVTAIRFGDVGERMLRGMRRAVAAIARGGNNVIVDDLLLAEAYVRDYVESLRGLSVTLVGVRCPLAVVNAREAARPGRFPGTAESHFHTVHAHCVYDVEVDTGSTPPRACAEQVVRAMASGVSAFDRLAAGVRS